METSKLCVFQDQINAIVESNLADIDKLKQGFGLVTGFIIDHAEKERVDQGDPRSRGTDQIADQDVDNECRPGGF